MSLLQIADSTGKMNYVCSNAAKHELEPVEISAHCVLFHRKPSPAAHSLQGPSRDLGGSCRFGKGQVGVGYPVKSMPKAQTQHRAIVCRSDMGSAIICLMDLSNADCVTGYGSVLRYNPGRVVSVT
jgi:hypothetical protein